jgi:hemoglobin/transferrin/lactoferrin receptor protein
VLLDVSLFDEEVRTDVSSLLGYGRQFRNTTALQGDDRRTRYAARLGYEFVADRWWIDHGRLNGYWQKVEVDQRTADVRAALNTLNERAFSYDTESYGVTLDLGTRVDWGGFQHRLAWGGSVEHSRVIEQRDGAVVDLLTGQRNSSLLGEVMPVRDFPRSTVDEVGLYAHDEMTLGRLTLIPGLRFQSYRLDARTDPVYAEDNPATDVIDARESVLAPKLGLLWRVSDRTQAYFQYAHGFRAPPFEDLNIGLDNPLFNYRAIPNPDLDPETSDGVEVGLRYLGADARFGVAIFGTEYDDLIETKVNLGRDENGTLIFQSRNIEAARVYGAELTFDARLDRWVPGLRIEAAASIARGENRTTGEPLQTVDPAELVTRFVWSRSDRFRLGLALTAVAAKDDVDDSIANPMTTDGYVVVDLTGSLRLTPGVRIDAGLFNAFDETYWQWSAVRNRAADDPMVDHLSAPGRYASVALRVAL